MKFVWTVTIASWHPADAGSELLSIMSTVPLAKAAVEQYLLPLQYDDSKWKYDKNDEVWVYPIDSTSEYILNRYVVDQMPND